MPSVLWHCLLGVVRDVNHPAAVILKDVSAKTFEQPGPACHKYGKTLTDSIGLCATYLFREDFFEVLMLQTVQHCIQSCHRIIHQVSMLVFAMFQIQFCNSDDSVVTSC